MAKKKKRKDVTEPDEFILTVSSAFTPTARQWMPTRTA